MTTLTLRFNALRLHPEEASLALYFTSDYNFQSKRFLSLKEISGMIQLNTLVASVVHEKVNHQFTWHLN
ncbi:MAG TPA: hypothetical protein VNW99_05830 [Cytophagaceae bacterium]|jgi:hypothetical protein|nr:hypothetical protein [Cytophagaceae bacterium]